MSERENYDLTFDDIYNDYFLIEINPKIEKELDEGNLFLKQSKDDSTLLVTKDNTYELKFLECSNTYLIAETKEPLDCNKNSLLNDGKVPNKKLVIKSLNNYFLEAAEINTSIQIVVNMLKSTSNFKYCLSTGEPDYSRKLKSSTLNDLINDSELSINKLQSALTIANAFILDNNVLVFDTLFLYTILRDLLIVIQTVKYPYEVNFSILNDEIFTSINENYSQIFTKMNSNEKHAILSNFSDICFDENLDNTNKDWIYLHTEYLPCLLNESKISYKYKLNWNKLRLVFYYIIVYLENEKNNKSSNKLDNSTNLDDFAIKMKSMYSHYLPTDISRIFLQQELDYTSTKCEDNLYEGLKTIDLRFLKQKAIIQFPNHGSIPYITPLDNHMIREKLEDKISDLFTIKDKWTYNELLVFIENDFNFKDKINKLCKQVSEKNPFNNQEVVYYKLRLKF
jgi:hypothetical protein